MGGACKNYSAIPLLSSRNDFVLTSSMGFCCKVILNDEFLDHLVKDINWRSWTVKLSYVCEALSFASGWHSFTLDHGIKPHNQVLFIYISDSNFLCQIFGNNSSKKWWFPSACNNRPSSSYANEDSSDGNITQINKEGSPLEQGKEDYFNLPIFEEDMRIPCEGGEDFVSSLLESFPSTLVVSGNEKHVVAFAQIAPFEEPSVVAQSADLYPRTVVVQGLANTVEDLRPPVKVKAADLEPQTTACQGPPAEAKAADLKPQTTAFKGQTYDVIGHEPSHIEFFEITHKKSDGGLVDNRFSAKLINEAKSKVHDVIDNSSPSKSRTEIENEVFYEIMYGDAHPKRPIGYGFGVKQSQVSGVHSLLRTREYKSASTLDNSAQLQARILGLEKQNQELQNLLLQTLQAVRDRKIFDNAFNGIQYALSNPNFQVNPARNDDGTRNESNDLDPPSSS